MDDTECPTCGTNMALHDCTCDDSEPQAVSLTIPGTPAYSLSPNARCHWAVKQRETKDAAWAVKAALVPFGMNVLTDWDFHGPVKLHWTIYLEKGGKKRDMTNVIPALKAHEDALVRQGVIPGDSPKHIPEVPKVDQIPWSKHKGEPKIIVVIEEVR